MAEHKHDRFLNGLAPDRHVDGLNILHSYEGMSGILKLMEKLPEDDLKSLMIKIGEAVDQTLHTLSNQSRDNMYMNAWVAAQYPTESTDDIADQETIAKMTEQVDMYKKEMGARTWRDEGTDEIMTRWMSSKSLCTAAEKRIELRKTLRQLKPFRTLVTNSLEL